MKTICRIFAISTVLFGAAQIAAGEQSSSSALPDKIEFNRDIRPILAENCYSCHGPDASQRKADLRLDTRDGLFAAIEDVHPVIPEHPEQSEIYRRITNDNPDERMPHPKSS